MMIGRQLGDYQIVALLGEGGMGQVYQGRARSLGRDAAIKVFAIRASPDRDDARRFRDEATLASSLNHPNIVTVYGIGEEEDVAYIAMELVKGRTLRELLTGPLPPAQALDYAVQIAGALATAHEAGVIHRDLKPENVMVTPQGLIKIRDFGLARREPALLAPSIVDSALTQAARTTPGTILGTVGYTDPNPPPPFVPALDVDLCRCWHSGVQDLSFSARFNAITARGFALSRRLPWACRAMTMISAARPSSGAG